MSALPDSSFETPDALSTRDAAAALHVSETTLRRALKLARDADPGTRSVSGECRGVAFLAWRETTLPRAPWRFVLDIDPRDAEPDDDHLDNLLVRAADDRIRVLRTLVQERDMLAPLPSPPATRAPARLRPWWRFWR